MVFNNQHPRYYNPYLYALQIMGKINTYRGIEVIPLNSNQQQTTSSSGSKPNFPGDLRMNRLPYMADRTLVPRVQKYLEKNVDKVYVSINAMADELQRTYKEYAKRKRNAFRGSVKRAYSIVMQSYGLDDQQGSSSEEPSDEEEDDVEVRHHDNILNNQLNEMYGRNVNKPPIDSNELIDISSGDSDEGASEPKQPANGAPARADQGMLPEDLVETEMFRGPDRSMLKGQLPGRGKKRKMDTQFNSFFNVKRKKSVANLEESYVTFKDVGGMDKTLEEICKLLVHIRHPEIYRQIGISPPRGFLLHGPPGCGKTLLANAIAGELEVPLLKVSAPELVAGVSGESEERIRELFEKATVASPCVLFIDEIDAITPNRQNAQKEMERRIVAQLLTCLDDLSKSEMADQVLVIGATNRPDALDPALRRAGRFDREVCLGIPDVSARIHILKVLTTKLKLGEGFDYETIAKHTPGYVGADLVALTREAAMAAVSRVFAELKAKRELERAIALQKIEEEKNKSPQPAAVEEQAETKEEEVVDVETPDKKDEKETDENGAGDAVVIIDDDVKEKGPEPTTSAAMNHKTPAGKEPKIEIDLTPKTTLEELISWLHGEIPLTDAQLNEMCITMDDFAAALKCVQPSAKREGFVTVPDTTWDDVGSLGDIRQELQMAILAPVRHAEQYKALGMTTPTGVLLCGPPGCGKTLLAKAIANEAGINFISVKGPELLNMYVGESERAVRTVFARARNSAPCVIFFDELDALCPKRSDSGENGASMRVVNQILTEMDGIEGRKDVYILAATNRPDIVDPAVLRPGRLDKILYVGLPTSSDRVDILRTITKCGTKPLLAPDVDLEIIGKSEECDGYTGADLAALVREASVEALKEFMLAGDLEKVLIVTTEHFKRAVARIRPSVNEKDQKHYQKLKQLYGRKSQVTDEMEMEYS